MRYRFSRALFGRLAPIVVFAGALACVAEVGRSGAPSPASRDGGREVVDGFDATSPGDPRREAGATFGSADGPHPDYDAGSPAAPGLGLDLGAFTAADLSSPPQPDVGARPDALRPADAAAPDPHAGAADGIWYWELPSSASGLKPTQSWSGAASAPDGTIYVGGMDHRTNSALYRLRDNEIEELGDARSASAAFGNWRTDEAAEKFHTRPGFMDGSVYVATLPRSNLDNGFLSLRGFHWYGYEIATRRFSDLSYDEPGGVGLPHGGPVSLVTDPARHKVYGLINPTGELVSFDTTTKRTTNHGRPSYGRPYVYPGRALWVDSSGRVYFSAGNANSDYYGGSYEPAVFNHIHYYEPGKGFGQRTGWQLHDQRAIDAAQCFPGVCYLMDNVGHVYRFSEAGPTWSYLGSVGATTQDDYGWVWVFHVTSDQKLAYIMSNKGQLWEFDLKGGEATRIANVKDLDSTLRPKNWLYGHNAWDAQGRFFFCAFTNKALAGPPALLVAIHPARLRAGVN